MVSGETIMKLLGGLFTLFAIYLIVTGSIILALRFRSGAGTVGGFWYTDRVKLNKYIFKTWVKWAGSPATFSNLSSNTVVNFNLYKKIEKVTSPAPCMLACDGANEGGKVPKCIGFRYEKAASANNCYLATTMDGIYGSDTSNSLYFVDGYDTAKQFIAYPNKVKPSPVGDLIINTPYKDTSIGCMSNCMSNVQCTGMTFSLTNDCSLFTKMDPATLVASTDAGSSVYGSHVDFTASSIKYY